MQKVEVEKELREKKRFQDFLYRNLKINKLWKKLHSSSDQRVQSYRTAKIHKLECIYEINVKFLNLMPITAQKGDSTFKAAQFISNYVNSLYTCNKYVNCKTQQEFLKLIQKQSPLQLGKRYISYNIESLFANVPIVETN